MVVNGEAAGLLVNYILPMVKSGQKFIYVVIFGIKDGKQLQSDPIRTVFESKKRLENGAQKQNLICKHLFSGVFYVV